MGDKLKHTVEELKEMQSWDLDHKIMVSQTRIVEWYIRYGGGVTSLSAVAKIARFC